MSIGTDTGADLESVARRTLAAHPSLYLATAGEAGAWVNGVYFAETDLFTIALILEEHGRTAVAIRHDPRIAAIVSTGSPADPFLQGSGRAEFADEASADEIRRVLLAKVPAAEPFMNLGIPIRALRLHIDSWRVTDVANGIVPGREITRTPGQAGARVVAPI
jgi:hypothetical protein